MTDAELPAIPEGGWVVSQEFQGGGDWLVHAPGLNRNPKIVRCSSEEDARRIAAALNQTQAMATALRDAELRGVRTGLEAAAKKVDAHLVVNPADAIRAIDPASVLSEKHAP